jgi:hypothetical protein
VARAFLPIQEVVRDLTSDLFGRGTAVDKTGPVDPDDVAAAVSYRDDNGDVVVVALFDADLVGIMGAALVLVPMVTVVEARRRGKLPENLVENFWEVANIFTSTLNRPGSPHLVMVDRVRSFDELGDDLRAVVDAPAKTRRFNVSIEGYGTGRMALFSA